MKKKFTKSNQNLVQNHSNHQLIPINKQPKILIKMHFEHFVLIIPIYKLKGSIKSDLNQNLQQFLKKQKIKFKMITIIGWNTINKNILKDIQLQYTWHLNYFSGQIYQIQPIYSKKLKIDCMKNYQLLKVIGTGQYSRLYLARSFYDGKFKTLKIFDKILINQAGLNHLIQNQKNIYKSISYPFINKLELSFESKNIIVFVHQYCPGGDLLFQIKSNKCFSQQKAQFYFVEILCTLNYLHHKQILYRSITPSNIHIEIDGHIKLCNFTDSLKKLPKNKLDYTLCGNLQYMPPQMINKNGHNYCLDFYNLGVLLYQMLTGKKPFEHCSKQNLFNKVNNQKVDTQNINISYQCKMILDGLLEKQWKKRLGCLAGARQILSHPWLKNLSFEKVYKKQYKSPFIPTLDKFYINEEQIENDRKAYLEDYLQKSQYLKFQTTENQTKQYQESCIQNKIISIAQQYKKKQKKNQSCYKKNEMKKSKSVFTKKKSCTQEKKRNKGISLMK